MPDKSTLMLPGRITAAQAAELVELSLELEKDHDAWRQYLQQHFLGDVYAKIRRYACAGHSQVFISAERDCAPRPGFPPGDICAHVAASMSKFLKTVDGYEVQEWDGRKGFTVRFYPKKPC